MNVYSKNKKALYDFEILEEYSAGISLLGFEVKSVKRGSANLKGSYVSIKNGEAYLVGAYIPPYQKANTPKEYNPERDRKLLLTKKEINRLIGKEKTKGLTMPAIMLYNKGGRIKLKFAVAKGKKKYDKREAIKKRDLERDLKRSLKYK